MTYFLASNIELINICTIKKMKINISIMKSLLPNQK
uniref:Uncharacterized protein n=1 Tax=viral metagenome TaxID=1070528 RepID=A0A6C0C7R1_9ZZZZ